MWTSGRGDLQPAGTRGMELEKLAQACAVTRRRLQDETNLTLHTVATLSNPCVDLRLTPADSLMLLVESPVELLSVDANPANPSFGRTCRQPIRLVAQQALAEGQEFHL